VQLTTTRTFTTAPYNWSSGDIGLFSLSGFIGCLFAFYLGGRLIDVISSQSTTGNGGPRLPEYRLPAIIIPGTIGPAGLLIFGLWVAHKTHWIGPAFGYAMQAFGVAAISNVAVTYSLEMYKPVSSQTSQ
jgi:MFS family permease